MTEDFKYPIGRYQPKEFSQKQKEEWIADIRFLPNHLEAALHDLDEAQIQTPYRDGGWTVHQLVHHVADSHMNAYIRFKLGATEENPAIKPYEEKLWAELEDSKELPINISITLLFALHRRWEVFLSSLSDEEWTRTVFHPEQKKEMALYYLLGLYAWHSRHHTAHINKLRERKGW